MQEENEKKENIENSDNNENVENEGNGKKTLIIEIVLALIAVGFIGFALYSHNAKNENVDTASVSSESANGEVINNDLVTTTDVNADTSVFYEDLPEMLDIDLCNEMTLEECQAMVEDGTLTVLNYNGVDIYVTNFTDAEYVKECLTYSEEELNDLIYSDLLQYFPSENVPNRNVAERYDTVEINYAGYMDGEAFAGGTAEHQTVALGAGGFIPGFEDGIIGMEVGEEKDINVTFPEDYSATELAGKDAVFTITLNEIVAVPEELTDDIVSQCFTEISTVDECVDYYKNYIMGNKVVEMITSAYYVSALDEDIVEQCYNSTVDMYVSMAAYYGASIFDLVPDIDEFKESAMAEACIASVATQIYNAIADYAEITIDDSDIEDLATLYGYDSVQDFYDAYGESTVKDYILSSKIVDYFIEIAQQ